MSELATRVYLDAITIRYASLDEKVLLPTQAGFAGPRLRVEDFEGVDDWNIDPATIAAQLRAAGIRTPGLVCSPQAHEWHNDGLHEPAVAAAVQRSLHAASVLEAPVLLLPVMSERGDLETLGRNLDKIAAQASDRGVKIGLEFIGHVPKVPDLRTAWRVVERCDPDSVGVVIDAFHVHRGRSELADIHRIPPERVLLVDLSDAMDLPVEDLLGYRHRLLPGTGTANVVALVRELVEHGYDGPFAVELFNEEYWQRPPAEFVREVYATTRAFFDQVLNGGSVRSNA